RWTLPGKKAFQLTFSRDGKYLASVEGEKVTIWDATTGNEVRTLAQAMSGNGVVFSPDNRRLASTSEGRVRLWDVATGTEQEGPTIIPDFHPYQLAFSPDGRRLAAVLNAFPNNWGSRVGIIQVWDTVTNELVLTLRGHTRKCLSLAFSPDGQ